ncbi:MAG TPA: ribonuclease III [Microbacteriaceae bacterium]|nr:ribonuclease III [Microbacteriaceae bacterium]
MSVTGEPSGSEVQAPGGFLVPFGITLAPKRLSLALTHRSWAAEHVGAPHNERLEFLGDSILGQVVSWRLYREFPSLPEGELSKRRAALVSATSLSTLARSITLGPHIRLGRGEKRSGGADKESILADVLEAVIGAVFEEHGAEVADRFVNQLIDPQFAKIEELIVFFDPKTTLQEEAGARGISLPVYEIETEGPDHDRRYAATVKFEELTGTGIGTNKKAAELLAAREVVSQLIALDRLRGAQK